MKKVLILLFFFLLVKTLPAQQTIADCVKNNFIHADSVNNSGKNSFEEWKICVIGKPMPGFIAKSITGDIIEMIKLKGKIVVINFWFIDCHPCIAELPALNKLVEEYNGKNIEFLAMTWETPKRIYEDFFSKYKLDFTIIPVDRNEIDKIVASGYPTTFIIDRQGIIKTAWNGGRTDEKAVTGFYEKAKPIIDELLKAE
jgi:thiol-disulfide isomerase/thioredoxin